MKLWQFTLVVFFSYFVLFTHRLHAQAIGVTNPAASGTYCAGANVNVTYTITGTFSNTPAANVFSAQVSDPSGSFGGTPVTVGTLASTLGGVISCTFPSTLVTSNLYRVRVISNNPPVSGSDNGANLTFFDISINQPTLGATSFCRGETFTVNFSQSSCNFVNVPTANVYSVELSNAAGSFASPVVIGTLASVTANTISCMIPSGQPAGTGYRIRISTNSPALTSADNGANITVVAPAGNPLQWGNGNWLIHCYVGNNDYVTDYRGFYTETALSFNSTGRWVNTASPSAANSTGGSAYSGCAIPTASYCYSYKRTNIPCGYYQVDIPQHRNDVIMLINRVVVFQHNVCCDAHTNAWRGVIQTTDSVEFRSTNSSPQGFLQATFTKLNQLVVGPAIRVCSASNASLTAINTGTLPVSYSWTPSATVVTPTLASTVANPISNTTFTISASSGTCIVFANSIVVTVAAAPAPNTSISTSTICTGQSIATITATGGQTYTWAPAAGLSSTTGHTVVANPTITTTYTMIASNNCSTLSTTRQVIVQNIPSAPSATAFGNNIWNVNCFSNSGLGTRFGFYTENNLSFTTTARWATNSTPSNANASSGSAYTGCNIATGNHGLVHKRTNFTCGYYRINLNHDESITLLINGVSVFSHATANHIDVGAWTGFLGPTSTVELRQLQTTGNSSLAVTFSIVTFPIMSPPITICAGTSGTLTAGFVSGLSYAWTPPTNLNTTTGTIVIASPLATTIYTCTVTDAVTSCTAANSNTVTVNPLPSTAATPLTPTINCSADIYTLTATGANSYTWSPAAGISTVNGYTTVATPTVSTIYTVTGSNNCATSTATVNVNVVPLINPTVFPTGTWNAYCYATTGFANYYGYYTENGSGTSGYDFNTTTKWAANALPSTANNTNGLAYRGCTMPASNWSIIYKRQNFACNAYSIQIPGNDDNVTIFINGTQVATRGVSSNSAPLWYGVLTTTSTVEIRHTQTTGTSSLNIVFTPAPNTQRIWAGSTSTNWFTNSNWCGSNPPGSADDVVIAAGGTIFKPTLNNNGGTCRSMTIMPAVAATTTLSAIGAASLTFGGSFDFELFGHFVNNGTLVQGTGRMRLMGNLTQSIISVATQTFYNLEVNNNATVIITPGIHRVSNNMNFIDGIVVSTGTLQLLNGATATGASNNSYVDGTVTKFGNQAFTFPIGGAGLYRPVSISAPVLATDNFRADYFNVDPSGFFVHTSKDVSINHISRCEYWTIDRLGGSSVVNVTLSWNVNSCGVNNLSDMIVTRWDAGQVKWKDHGNGGTTGNTTSGTVISGGAITGFSPFTLGSKSSLNPLPIELKEFTSTCDQDSVRLMWTTLTEKNNAFFSVEKSEDAITWKEITRLPSKGGSNIQNYFTSDRRIQQKAYYRLVQVDVDGKQKTYPIIEDGCDRISYNDFSVFPNPADKEVMMEIDLSSVAVQASIEIRSSTGQLLRTETISAPAGRTILNRRLELQSWFALCDIYKRK